MGLGNYYTMGFVQFWGIKNIIKVAQLMIRQGSAKLEQRMLEENNNNEPNNSENAEDQIQIQEGGQDPGQKKTKDNIARNQTKPETNSIGVNKKRRDLKMEREELTNLLVELIMYVNQRATGSEDCEDKMRNLGAGVNGVKNRVRPFRGKKEEDGKIGGGGPEEIFLRKGSIKDEKGCGERLEKEKWKRELFADYSGLMSYKIHSQQQRAQFTFNPLQAQPLPLSGQSPISQPTKTQQLLINGPRNDQQSESKSKPSAQTLARKNSKDSLGPGLGLRGGLNQRHFSVYRSVSIMIAPGGREGL